MLLSKNSAPACVFSMSMCGCSRDPGPGVPPYLTLGFAFITSSGAGPPTAGAWKEHVLVDVTTAPSPAVAQC